MTVVSNVYNQLLEFGKISRGQLGVYMNSLPTTEAMQKHFKLKNKHGVIITDIIEGDSPAKKAGIQQDDVIVAFNGKDVIDSDSLRDMVASTPPGTEVPVKVSRDGREITLKVMLNERPKQRQAESGKPMDLDEDETKPKQEIGLSVEDIPAKVASALDLKSDEGVLVSEVKQGSIAEEAGLTERDIIIAVNGVKVSSARDFVEKVRGLKAGGSAVLKFIKILQGRQKSVFYTSITKP